MMIFDFKKKKVKVKELTEKLGLNSFTNNSGADTDVTGGYVSDLLSDVMGNAKEGQVWITLQAHLNVVAIASLREISAVILVKGVKPSKEVIKKAEEEDLALLGCSEQTFEITGKFFNLLHS